MICHRLSNVIFFCADNSCHVFQHKGTYKKLKNLNEDFCNECDWFVDNKLRRHFNEDKTKSIAFALKFKRKNIKNLNIN